MPPNTNPDLTLIQSIFGSAFTSITQAFGVIGPNGAIHEGIDLAAKTGTPVPAFTSGTVVYAENASVNVPKAASYWVNNSAGTMSGGNAVIIQDANGVRYFYEHLNTIGVSVGQTVNSGTVVGTVGQTGDATGPHLHFAVADWNTKKWINPIIVLRSATSGSSMGPGAMGGGATAPSVDLSGITNVLYFIGIIVVGVVLLLLAGFVSKNTKGE